MDCWKTTVFLTRTFTIGACMIGACGVPTIHADEPPGKAETAKPHVVDPTTEKDASGLIRMAKDYEIWMDPKRKAVVVGGQVCLREGSLEMFACPKGTKEHESIVSVNCQTKFVHAALLAVGAKAGTPVVFDPEYSPPTGTPIDVFVLWVDTEGKIHQVRAQNWIRQENTGKEMSFDFVFAGSGFAKDETTGEEYYYGDSGDFICVSNFPTATLDIPVVSSKSNQSLMFLAWTDRIPKRGTKVRLVLLPRRTDEKAQPKGQGEQNTESAKQNSGRP